MKYLNMILNILVVFAIMSFGYDASAQLKESQKQDITSEINLIKNGGFENGLAGWTKTGASTLTKDIISPLVGKVSAVWDASAASETLTSELRAVPAGLFGRDVCSIQGLYQWDSGVKGDLVLQAWDGTTVLAQYEIDPTSGSAAPIIFPMFTCPSSGSLAYRLSSTTDAVSIEIDAVFQGGGRNSQNISQGDLVGGVSRTAPDALCIGLPTAINTGFVSFNVDADCDPWTELGLAENSAAQGVPRFDLPLKKGSYLAVVDFTFGGVSTTDNNTDCAYSLQFDGGRHGNSKGTLDSTGDQRNSANTFTTTFEVAADSTKTFEVVVQQSGGTIPNCAIRYDSASLETSSVKIYRLSGSVQTSNTFETSGFHVDVNIGGTSPSLSLLDQNSYTDITNSAMDMVINSGSNTAQIPCASGTASSGLTCSGGSEAVGIVFDAPTTGRYKVCGEFSHNIIPVGPNGQASTVFQWVETSNTSNAIIQEGNGRVQHTQDLAGDGTANVQVVPFNLCGSFNLATTGKKTFRLMYEQTITVGTISNNQIVMDRAVSVGQRDMHITVEKMDQQFPAPVFTDLQNSFNSINNDLDTKIEHFGINDMEICSFRVISSETPSLNINNGGCVASLADIGTAGFTATWNAGIFSAPPVCTCMAMNGSLTGFACTSSVPSAGAAAFATSVTSSGANSDAGVDVICIGPK